MAGCVAEAPAPEPLVRHGPHLGLILEAPRRFTARTSKDGWRMIVTSEVGTRYPEVIQVLVTPDAQPDAGRRRVLAGRTFQRSVVVQEGGMGGPETTTTFTESVDGRRVSLSQTKIQDQPTLSIKLEDLLKADSLRVTQAGAGGG